MAIKKRKCVHCRAEVTDDELEIVIGLVSVEMDETIKEMVAEDDVSHEEAVDRIVRSVVEDTPVCASCFIEVNRLHPLHTWVGNSPFATEPESFKWAKVRHRVLD